jgi:hypothetical protein
VRQQLGAAGVPVAAGACTLYEILAAFFGKMSSGIRPVGYAVEAPRATCARPRDARRIRPAWACRHREVGRPSNGVRPCFPDRKAEPEGGRMDIIRPRRPHSKGIAGRATSPRVAGDGRAPARAGAIAGRRAAAILAGAARRPPLAPQAPAPLHADTAAPR